uniref:Cellulase family glycosylhydrolase n=1 Tax=Roseihalotalea indica TaxID=2867963 RepID=A0AA49JCW5_9BACT|nr:cellulase family glycosylhydrolase [Tunicatimonas sp. TK19036]
MQYFNKASLWLLAIVMFSYACSSPSTEQETATTEDSTTMERQARWSVEQANEWYEQQGWMAGCDFIPSNAINQLEMWQEATFSPELIDKELGFAESIGFNAVRVYLHHLAWQEDQEGFKQRVEEYLQIADSHNIGTMFVIFDDVWNDTYQAGTQPEPKPGTHNSGWIQDPGKMIHDDSAATYPILEEYVKDIITTYKDDDRVVVWDLYNEPGNSDYENESMPLLQSVFRWATEVNPSQPLTVGVWSLPLEDLNEYQIAHSDVISYHNYGDKADHQQWINDLKQYGLPMLCTEYMARTRNSTFESILPMLKENNISAFNWGLVSGKTNTIYAWNTPIPDGSEPEIWFHDIFRQNGEPYSEEEVTLIKDVTGAE